MSDREDRLRSLLNKVRAKRPDERSTQAADVIERIRTASGAVPAAQPVETTPPSSAGSSMPAGSAPPANAPLSSVPVANAPTPSPLPLRSSSHPAHEPPTSPTVESPTRYSSQPPRVERPLSVEPRARTSRPVSSQSAPVSSASNEPARPASSQPARPISAAPGKPEAIRAESAAPTGQPVVFSTDAPEFPRPKTFGDLLELTLSLRPR